MSSRENNACEFQQARNVEESLSASRTRKARRKMGQFATPPVLAREMLQYARDTLSEQTRVRFLEPAFGTGAFYSALLQIFPQSAIARAVGYEIDPEYGQAARHLWKDYSLAIHIADYTRTPPPVLEQDKFNLILCNPPYVRHQELTTEKKNQLRHEVENTVGIHLGGLSGLYCYFLLLSDPWMTHGGLAGWLVPSEFMDVNYGSGVREYLLTHVTLLRIHRFDPNAIQFTDALVSSAVIWFRKESPPDDHSVEFTYGGTLLQPANSNHVPVKNLLKSTKWTHFPAIADAHAASDSKLRLGEAFDVKRGLATGANDFFLLTPKEIEVHRLPSEFLKPVLPPPRFLNIDEIQADSSGNPVLDKKMFLLSCDIPEREVKSRYPSLWEYLKSGIERGINQRYLCRHRSPWYSQEKRPPAPIICTYIGRCTEKTSNPFRFILNHSRATATNVYLMLYPRPIIGKRLENNVGLLSVVWKTLRQIPPSTMLSEGRVYGGGLHKLEPRELSNVNVSELASIFSIGP